MIVLYQERVKDSGIWWERGLLPADERKGRIKAEWRRGRYETALRWWVGRMRNALAWRVWEMRQRRDKS